MALRWLIRSWVVLVVACGGTSSSPDGGPCSTPADCPDPLRYTCQAGRCVPTDTGCASDGDCLDPTKPHCANGTCQGCVSDSHCVDPLLPRCLEGECVASGACTADNQCTGAGAPYCLEGACVQCRTNTHCLEPGLPVCRSGVCSPDGCTSDSQCTEAGLPYCSGNHCVQCRTNTHCQNPDLPLCDGGTCVADNPPCGEGAKPTDYTWPVPDVRYVCQEFNVPVDYQTCGFHTGTDICASATGPDIESIADGRVVYVGPLWLQGADVGRGDHAIIVQHSPQFYSTYSHNQSALVGAGDCVQRGQHIAELGDEGYSYGPHLHIEILSGTSFTGDWETPFQNACSHYEDLRDYVNP